MRRILSSDCYRAIHNPMVYAVPAGFFMFLVMAIFVGNRNGGQIGINTIIDNTNDMLMLVFIAADIVLINMWSGEHKHGFIKNLAGNVSGRQILPISKMVIGIVICAIYMIMSFGYMVGGNTITGVKIVGAPFGNELIQLLLWYLTGIASVALDLMLYEVFNSPTLCYIASIMLWTGMFEQIILQLFYLITDSEFNLARYMLLTGMNMEESGNAEDLVRILLYIAVFCTTAIFAARKKDIRA
ncbi:MAG: hypothetical protein K6E62_05440 [Lachnospiraceae bacterium]|nr:hypothetical protein [Lachnospiraceae bacterium]